MKKREAEDELFGENNSLGNLGHCVCNSWPTHAYKISYLQRIASSLEDQSLSSNSYFAIKAIKGNFTHLTFAAALCSEHGATKKEFH